MASNIDELLSILLQRELEAVSPKLEAFRDPWRIKLAKGGRGAGAKSWGVASLVIQAAHKRKMRIGVFREVQKSLEESSQQLMIETIQRLGYKGWTVTKSYLRSPTGSHIVFRGLNDLRAAGQVKGLEGFDLFVLEEAAQISDESITMILPTLRKKGSELWAVYNQESENDPIDRRLWQSERQNVLRVWLEPGRTDNPWWTEELENEMIAAFADDPDEAEHIWNGFPRKQSKNAVISRTVLRETENRILEDDSGAVEIGCDVARFGADSTIAFKRKGFKIIDRREVRGADTTEVSAMLWDMANMDPKVPIKVDSGYNPGVIDVLASFGAFVVSVGFGERALKEDKYPNSASEMMFELPINQISIPSEYMTKTLIEDLTERLYSYDTQGRKRIEPKDGTSVVEGSSKGNFKARHGGRSPDEGDALCLAFYSRVPNWEVL